jgi:hypothetical protein
MNTNNVLGKNEEYPNPKVKHKEKKGSSHGRTISKKEKDESKTQRLPAALRHFRVNPKETKEFKETIKKSPGSKLPPELANFRVNPSRTKKT